MPAASTTLNAKMRRGGVERVRCQFIDLIGIARGRLVPASRLADAMRRGVPFGAFGTTLDIDDIPSDPALGSHSGDMWAIPDPASYRPLPWLEATGHLFCDLVSAGGAPWPSCARSRLRCLVTEVEKEIGSPEMAFESEGYLLTRTEAGYEPAYRGHGWGAELLDIHSALIDELAAGAEAMSLPVERMQVEGGHSQFETVMRHGDPVETAQDHFRFKQLFRAVARRHGLVGTFMPKPLADRDGSGLHVHVSARRGTKTRCSTATRCRRPAGTSSAD